MRASGVTAGVLVAALDMAKGAASVWLAARVSTGARPCRRPRGWRRSSATSIPIWLRFRGGKGVATACGVFSVLTPLAMPPALAIFAAVVWLTKYISLGSVVASIALPPLAYALGSPAPSVLAAARRGDHHRLQAPLERRCACERARNGGSECAP